MKKKRGEEEEELKHFFGMIYNPIFISTNNVEAWQNSKQFVQLLCWVESNWKKNGTKKNVNQVINVVHCMFVHNNFTGLLD